MFLTRRGMHLFSEFSSLQIVGSIFIFLISLFARNVVAADIGVWNHVVAAGAKIGLEKQPVVPEKGVEVDAAIDGKKNSAVKSQDLSGEGSGENSALNGLSVKGGGISKPIFEEQEGISKELNSKLDNKSFYPVKKNQDLKKYNFQDDFFSYKNMLYEVQIGLGDEIYDKLVWTYYGIKDIDDLIYSRMAEYNFNGSDFVGKFRQFVGLDSQMSAMIVLGGRSYDAANMSQFENFSNKTNHKDGGGKVVLDFSYENISHADAIEISRIYAIFKYLTIKNFIYFLLGVMGISMLRRVFRFFIKQDLS